MRMKMLSNEDAVSTSIGSILTFTITVVAMLMVMNSLYTMMDQAEHGVMAEQTEIYGNDITLQITNIETMIKVNENANMSVGEIRRDIDLPERIAGQPYSVEFSSTSNTIETTEVAPGGPVEDKWFTDDGNQTGNPDWIFQDIDTIDTFTISIPNRSNLSTKSNTALIIQSEDQASWEYWKIRIYDSSGTIYIFFDDYTGINTFDHFISPATDEVDINILNDSIEWVDTGGDPHTLPLNFHFDEFAAARTIFLEFINGDYGYGHYTISGYLTNGTRFTIGGGGTQTTTSSYIDYTNEIIFRSLDNGRVLTKVEFVNMTTSVESATIYSNGGDHYLLYNPTTNTVEVY